jgi:UPF0755 protein
VTPARPNPARAADKPIAQPPRAGGAIAANRPNAPPAHASDATKSAAAKATGSSAPPRPAGTAPIPRPSAATPAAPTPPAAPKSRPLAKPPVAAGDPSPPISGRPAEAAGAAAKESKESRPTDSKRIMPRSPRTAIEPDRVEMPIRRSARARHPLVVFGNAIISLLVLLAVGATVVLFIGKQRFEASGPLPQDRIVNIPRGTGIRDIADVLTREGVIDQPWVFVGGVLALKAREDLKAGEYQFKAHSSVSDVVATMVEGRVVAHQVSIPEGLTSQQAVARLQEDDVLTGDIKAVPREGSLLPDTYNFTRGMTREQMIQRMQQAQQRLVQDIWEHRSADLPVKSPDQLVVLASLVEKETAKPEERSRVAAVFLNRLKQKMKLQSDPTIIYGLVGGKGTLGRPIMKSEITQPTPYNTYLIDGLPPGPIANPGRASLEAAANPARTRELYFVADGTGGHAFAETYEQHQKNVARLRLIETDQKDQLPLNDQMNADPAPAASPSGGAAPPPLRGAAKPHPQPNPQPAAH